MRLFRSDATRYREWQELYERARHYFTIPGVVKQSVHFLREGDKRSEYLDFDYLVSDPVRCEEVARLFAGQIEEINFEKSLDFLSFVDKGGEGTIGAIAIAGALSIFTSLPLVYVRPWKDVMGEKVKCLRTPGGQYSLTDARGILVTDHCTTGREALQAVHLLRDAETHVEDVLAYSYRSENFDSEAFDREGIEFYSLYDAKENLGKTGVNLIFPKKE